MPRRSVLAAAAAAVLLLVTGIIARVLPLASAATSLGTTAAATTPANASPAPAGSPVAVNGLLHVCGVNLCNRANKAVQLHGMSSHGIQFFPNCLNPASLSALRKDWKADLI